MFHLELFEVHHRNNLQAHAKRNSYGLEIYQKDRFLVGRLAAGALSHEPSMYDLDAD